MIAPNNKLHTNIYIYNSDSGHISTINPGARHHISGNFVFDLWSTGSIQMVILRRQRHNGWRAGQPLAASITRVAIFRRQNIAAVMRKVAKKSPIFARVHFWRQMTIQSDSCPGVHTLCFDVRQVACVSFCSLRS